MRIVSKNRCMPPNPRGVRDIAWSVSHAGLMQRGLDIGHGAND